MRYKIVVDSCCELPDQYLQDPRFQRVTMHMEVGNEIIDDDETFDQASFLDKIARSTTSPKSSCSSPEAYCESYVTEAEHVYVVTLSANLSGSHNSASLGKSLYQEKYGDKKIFIVDSCSASVGETQIALHAMELEDSGLYSFEEICDKLTAFRDDLATYFVLDNLDTLRKNGRLTGVKALVVSSLNIKPVMGATMQGTIIQRGQSIGIRKALSKMVDLIVEEIKNPEQKILMISHCNCYKRAEGVRDLILSKVPFRDFLILDTAGISSMYANDGGIIVVV